MTAPGTVEHPHSIAAPHEEDRFIVLRTEDEGDDETEEGADDNRREPGRHVGTSIREVSTTPPGVVAHSRAALRRAEPYVAGRGLLLI